MMANASPDPIVLELRVAAPPETAFRLFTTEIGTWWPVGYTWAQSRLSGFRIDPWSGGLCLETDRDGTHTVWGFVVDCSPGERLSFRWMIEGDRGRQPDPAHASLVTVTWAGRADDLTVRLVHDDFHRHTSPPDAYRNGLASPQGWPYLLDLYAAALKDAD